MKDFKNTLKILMQILNQTLRLNENFKINNKSLYNKQFIDKDILYIKYILDENANFFNHMELTSKYKLFTTFTECLQQKPCIPIECKDHISKVKMSASKISKGNCTDINNKYTNIDKIQCKDILLSFNREVST